MMKKILFAILSILTLGTCVVTGVVAINESTYSYQQAEALTTSQIKTIQTKLKKWGYYKQAVDGIYGSGTREAVKYFQRKNGLVVDGIIGPKTLAALGMSTGSGGSSSSSNVSNSDLYLLAKCVHAEARGESYVGQVAVAAIILNRVKSNQFPNTIAGVIYQPYAFTAVQDGQINLEPNKTAYSAAQDALNGWDPTYGCLYYYNPATATSKWIYSRKTVVTIGKHVFAI
jgi:N-acetylmuramoyl-L-alanine amidase